MKVYSAQEIRNIVVLGHSGCGKTTLMEASLFAAQLTSRMGRVEDGNTVSDYDQEEIRRRVSISSAIIPIEWLNTKINFIDTPGYFDFVGEVKSAVAAADMALIVVSAKSGVEVGTEKAWEYATQQGIPKMIFINGMDDENADYDKVIEEIRAKLGSVTPLQLPLMNGGRFAGIIDIMEKKGYTFSGGKATEADIDQDLSDNVSAIMESIAESDEALMDKFFNEEPFTDEEISTGLKNGICAGILTPILCGCATAQIGVTTLMNFIVQKTPSAAEVTPSVKATNLKTKAEFELACADNGQLAAFVFKTIADPYVGRLSIFRVYSGVLKRETHLYNVDHDFAEKVGHIYVLRGKEQIEVTELRAGDIGAIAKLQHTATQDTLCTKEAPVKLKEINFPSSLLSMAIMPKGKGDEDKLSQAISKLLEEDKTLHFEVNKETKQSLVYGVGDNQLDVMVNKLKNKYKLDVELSTPIIPYREMIKSKVKVQGKYKKQSGGHGQYGDVHIEFEPAQDTTVAYVFEEKIFGGAVPKQYFPAVEKGIQECVKAGPLAGFPVVGIKCTLVDGSYHAVDSSEMAFKMATSMAFKDGFIKAKPTILEPIARAEVVVPDDYTGDIMGDFNKRRGRILGMDKQDSKQKIIAEVPLAEMFEYPTDLRSITQGRGEFTMQFDRYEEAPAEVQKKVIEARKAEVEKLKNE